MSEFWIETIGYVGSALVVLSITRTSIVRLRAIGLAGSLFFLTYSLLIEAYPIAAVNTVIAAIHIYFLIRLTRSQDEIFSLLDIDPQSKYLEAFLDFHRPEIARSQPEFSPEVLDGTRPVFVLRDMVPAGLVIARSPGGNGALEVLLDYAIPQYRDLRLGKFVFGTHSPLTDGIDTVVASATTEEHAQYLERLGFAADDTGRYVKRLAA